MTVVELERSKRNPEKHRPRKALRLRPHDRLRELALADRRRRTLVAAVRRVEVGGNGHPAGDARTLGGDGDADLGNPALPGRQRDQALLGDADRDF